MKGIKQHLKDVCVNSIFAFVFIVVGFGLGCAATKAKPHSPPPPTVAQQIEALPDGTTIKYEFKQREIPQTEKHTGGTTNVGADKTFWRGLSWFGLGGPEAASKDQGLVIDGKNISAGQMYGYGWAEQLWNRIKSLFWFLTFGAVVLVVLLFIPFTAPIASAILRFFASLIPIVGSVFESIRAGIVYKKPLVEVVQGGEAFKDLLEKDAKLDLTIVQKDGVWELFKAGQTGAQDKTTQAAVDKMTAMKCLTCKNEMR